VANANAARVPQGYLILLKVMISAFPNNLHCWQPKVNSKIIRNTVTTVVSMKSKNAGRMDELI